MALNELHHPALIMHGLKLKLIKTNRSMRFGNVRTRRPGNANPIALGIIFVLVSSAVFFFFALPPLQYSNSSKSWPTVQGIVTRSEIDVWSSDGRTHYEPKIAYYYIVDGKKYTSSQIKAGDPVPDNNVTNAKRLQAEYPVNSEVTVYYDPELPESAALQPGSNGIDYLPAAMCGIFFFVGLITLYQGLKARRRAVEAKNASNMSYINKN